MVTDDGDEGGLDEDLSTIDRGHYQHQPRRGAVAGVRRRSKTPDLVLETPAPVRRLLAALEIQLSRGHFGPAIHTLRTWCDARTECEVYHADSQVSVLQAAGLSQADAAVLRRAELHTVGLAVEGLNRYRQAGSSQQVAVARGTWERLAAALRRAKLMSG